MDLLVGHHVRLSSQQLRQQRERLFPPTAQETVRKITSGKAADSLGVKDAYLRKLHLDSHGPDPETCAGGRRYYSAADVRPLRRMLEPGVEVPGTSLPGRRNGYHVQVVCVINFKRSSAKTKTTAHPTQKMALDGYRVLAIGLDPLASLSAPHGDQPELGSMEYGTLHDTIRSDDPLPLVDIIRPTNSDGLDIVPGTLELLDFDPDTTRRGC